MARSTKDLREVINISRISLRNDTSSDEISDDEVNAKSRNFDKLTDYLLSRSSSTLTISSFNTLPFRNRPNTAFGTKNFSQPFLKRPVSAPAVCEMYSKNFMIGSIHEDIKKANFSKFENILSFVDGTIVNSWLQELDFNRETIILFLKKNNQFVEFCNFFLNMSTHKWNKLIELEFSILIDQLKYAFHAGFEGGYLTESNIFALAQTVVAEYPKKLKGSKGSEILLDIIIIFLNGKSDHYRSLLKKAVCKVKSKQNLQWLLAFRAFGLINMINGILNFFKNTQLVCNLTSIENSIVKSSCYINDWMIYAVKKGYKNVCLYFLNHQKEYCYNTICDNHLRNLVFIAIVEREKELAELLLSYLSSSCLNEAADNGNSPLHYTVGKGDLEMTHFLLKSGADVNIFNYQCEYATPLHIAVMLGDLHMVGLLLRYGADKSLKMGIPPTVTPYVLACDLNHEKIKELLKQKES
ncbi:uncharacterized protein LOC100197660 [Hydra vulgaris]|uniref:Uncharacterized protein LOC100197660 n=1 Tax=Hydra vulgaris TaxID=6087 RepID=A0ABM4CH79_HYDVU